MKTLSALSVLVLGLASASEARAQAPVDLLHAVSTDVAVSSVYRSQRVQVDRLVDGDLETAWNSRTGDLAGAWIDVRIPDGATVTSIAITPGFTHRTPTSDLFTSNQRVSRVRVLRDGTELGTYPLDTSAPVLVTIPVSGPSGVYRIEMAEMIVGSRADWRETCISELRVFGTAPSMTPDARLPRTAVGALPAVQTLVLDRVAIDRSQRHEVAWLTTTWTALQQQYDYLNEYNGGAEETAGEARDLAIAFTAMLQHVAAFVAPVDPVRADALRIAAVRTHEWNQLMPRRLAWNDGFERVTAAFDAVTTFLAADESRCRSERAIAGILLRHVASAAHTVEYMYEISDGMGEIDSFPRGIEADDTFFAAAIEEWSRNSRGVAARLSRHAAPVDAGPAAEWPALLTRLGTTRASCGWAP